MDCCYYEFYQVWCKFIKKKKNLSCSSNYNITFKGFWLIWLFIFLLICTCTYNIRQRRIERVIRRDQRPGCEIVYPPNFQYPSAPPAYNPAPSYTIPKYGSIQNEEYLESIQPPPYSTVVNELK